MLKLQLAEVLSHVHTLAYRAVQRLLLYKLTLAPDRINYVQEVTSEGRQETECGAANDRDRHGAVTIAVTLL